MKIIKKRHDLYNHLRTHAESHPCEQCIACFVTDKQLQRHILEHKKKSFIQCSICLKQVESHHMNRHKRYAHTLGRFSCPIDDCDISFKHKNLIVGHLERKHVNAFKCNCGRLFQRRREMIAHQDKEHGDDKIHCRVCARTFNYSSDMWMHVKKVHPDSKTVKCNRCMRSFLCPSEMYTHKLDSHYPCNLLCSSPGCGLRFDCVAHYDRHYQKTHASLREKIAFSNDSAERWMYKCYFIRSLLNNSFKIGMTRTPISARLNRYIREDHYEHELVDWWPMPDFVNNHRCYAHQIENMMHLLVFRAGFELVEGKLEFFKFRSSPLEETIQVWNILMSASIFSDPLRLATNSSNKLYLVYNETLQLSKVGYTTEVMSKRLSQINEKHEVGKFIIIDIIYVDPFATVHELKAWENDILVRIHQQYGLVKNEYFNCAKADLDLAKQIFHLTAPVAQQRLAAVECVASSSV
jgi:hypothetical protein